MHTPAAFALALLLLVAGCAQEPEGPKGPQLPPETQTGAGTLGFKIGDKIYVAASASGQISQAWDNTLAVTSGNGVEGWGFFIEVDSINNSGAYRIDTVAVAPFLSAGPGGYLITSDCVGRTSSGEPYTGTLQITRYDPVARVLSGRFEMNLFSSSPMCAPNIRITEGRFDVRF